MDLFFVLKCWYFSRWVFRIWRQKYREGKGKEKTTNLSHTFGVCVCGDRKAKQCFGWKEREERARENQPSEPCRLWAPPKSEKIENWDVGHGFEILEPNKNFQFWILSEIQFWEMSNVFELCVLSYKFWVLSFEFWDASQSKYPLSIKGYPIHLCLVSLTKRVCFSKKSMIHS